MVSETASHDIGLWPCRVISLLVVIDSAYVGLEVCPPEQGTPPPPKENIARWGSPPPKLLLSASLWTLILSGVDCNVVYSFFTK